MERRRKEEKKGGGKEGREKKEVMKEENKEGMKEGRGDRRKDRRKEGRKKGRPHSGVGLTHVCSPSALCWVAKRQFSHKSTACTLRGHSSVYHLLLPPERFSSPVCSAPHSAAG